MADNGEREALCALTPLDGRYATKSKPLRNYFSEKAYIQYRVRVEIAWLIFLSEMPDIPEVPPFAPEIKTKLLDIVSNFSVDNALRVKEFESKTNHDVKAMEYWMKETFAAIPEIIQVSEFIHFACTSEDINNLAIALMLKSIQAQLQEARAALFLPQLRSLTSLLTGLAHETADVPLLARTHGQAASPTTLGKEVAIMAHRIGRAVARFAEVPLLGKWNGAVGNFNAHLVSYPAVDWVGASQTFVEGLGLQWNAYTTQIESHDGLAELLDAVAAINTCVLSISRDMWQYISHGCLGLRTAQGEVGSSVMPHKVNPIDFENSEGNAGIATAMLRFMADKLPVSRLQRDLSDSTVLRSLGAALGHSALAWDSCARGLTKLQPCVPVMAAELDAHWEVLAEAVQTVMRRHGLPAPYEQLKALTRGHSVNRESLHAFIDSLSALPSEERERLKQLTPALYTGLAGQLARQLVLPPA